jgi:hypothetical protein
MFDAWVFELFEHFLKIRRRRTLFRFWRTAECPPLSAKLLVGVGSALTFSVAVIIFLWVIKKSEDSSSHQQNNVIRMLPNLYYNSKPFEIQTILMAICLVLLHETVSVIYPLFRT